VIECNNFGWPLLLPVEATTSCADLVEAAWVQVRRFAGLCPRGAGADEQARARQRLALRSRTLLRGGAESLGVRLVAHEDVTAADELGLEKNDIDMLALDWADGAVDELDAREAEATDEHAELPPRGSAAAPPPQGEATLAQCLELFTRSEALEGENAWYCSACKAHRDANKSLCFWRLPEVLIVQLKRFDFRGSLMRDKIDAFVDFPLDSLDMAPYCAEEAHNEARGTTYDLFAVCNHYGRMGFGHYTAATRRWEGAGLSPTWCTFDDETVLETDEREVRSRAAYMLFYRRRPAPVRANGAAEGECSGEEGPGDGEPGPREAECKAAMHV